MSQYWYCLRHRAVEPEAGCRAMHRLGPYASEAAAARALDQVEERNEDWDNDPRWNDVDPDEDDPADGDPAGGDPGGGDPGGDGSDPRR